MKTEKELDIIRGKMLVNKASQNELQDFLEYVNAIEALLDEGDMDDMYGTEGWRHRIGFDEY